VSFSGLTSTMSKNFRFFKCLNRSKSWKSSLLVMPPGSKYPVPGA